MRPARFFFNWKSVLCGPGTPVYARLETRRGKSLLRETSEAQQGERQEQLQQGDSQKQADRYREELLLFYLALHTVPG